MSEEILQIIAEYGIETVIIAIAVNILTGLIKLPIKSMAQKTADSTKITRYLVFLPILMSFGLTVLYFALIYKKVEFDTGFLTLWLASGSLSLSLYAIYEKMFPSKKKVLKESEIEANRYLLEEIKELTAAKSALSKQEAAQPQNNTENTFPINKKIILRGSGNAKAEIKKE